MEFKELSTGTWFHIPNDTKKYLKIEPLQSPFNAKSKELLFRFPDNQIVTILDNTKRGT